MKMCAKLLIAVRAKEGKDGHYFYECECGRYRFVPFRCKSRLCPTCGYQYQTDRAKTVKRKLINCKHRHIVFTIPEELRYYFRKDRNLLNTLFLSAAATIDDWLKSKNKSKQFTMGMINTLHTFGRDLKWNPHIHMLCTMAANSKTAKNKLFPHKPCKIFDFIPFPMLRKRFMTTLLFRLKPYIPKHLIDHFYSTYKDGFYVYAEDKKMNLKDTVDYILRYIGRPAIAKKRILAYDGKTVTFCYNRHEDNKYVEETLHAHEFTKRVIVHVPEKYFNMIRYYGLYSNLNHGLSTFHKKGHAKTVWLMNLWHMRIFSSFGHHPLKCASCGKLMTMTCVFVYGKPRPPPKWYTQMHYPHYTPRNYYGYSKPKTKIYDVPA